MNFKRTLIGCFSILFAAPFFARAMDPINVSSISLNEKKENSPTISLDEEKDQCPICKENIKNKFITPCRHEFCKKCIFHWIKRRNSCPMCRECQLKRKIRIMNCFLDKGFIDVRDLPETKDKNFEEIIDFLKTNYPNYKCTIFKARDEIGGRVHGSYYGIADTDGHPILVDTPDGTRKLGIYDINYFNKGNLSKYKLCKIFKLF